MPFPHKSFMFPPTLREPPDGGTEVKQRGRPKARLLSINEVAEYLHVSRQTIYRLIEHKALPHVRIGYVLRFDLPTVLAWAEAFTKTGDKLTWLDDFPELKERRRRGQAES